MEYPLTLEEHLQRLADLIAASRATRWEIGDHLGAMVREYGRGVLGKAAELCGCSKTLLRQMIRVSAAIPREHRHPDVPWSVAREAVQRAASIGMEPLQLYLRAVHEDWGLRQLIQAVREARGEPEQLCPTCGRPLRRRKRKGGGQS